jgi:two-component system LytT family response regulator
MTKVVIVDDEAHGIRTIELLLKQLNYDIEIIATFTNSNEAINTIPNLEFDILFLDIEMPFHNGFELLNQLHEINFSVIFTTAYNEYAITAFKYAAFDYLLKPIGLSDLNHCIGRWKAISHINNQNQIKYLSDVYDKKTRIDKITIPDKDGYQLISINQIVFCSADSNYCNIILDNGINIFTSKSLKEIEYLLSSHSFERIHKSYLINILKIKSIQLGKDYFIKMENSELIPVSRKKHHIVESLFNKI